MKIIRIEKKLTIDTNTAYKRDLNPGESYVFSTLLAQNLHEQYAEYFGTSTDINAMYKPYRGQDLNDKTLLCWRHGGIGDLMFMMPALRTIKKIYPKCQLWVAAGTAFVDIYKNIPYIDVLLPMPLHSDRLLSADYHLHFEGIIEKNKEASKKNAYDLFLEAFTIDPDSVPQPEKIPDVYLTSTESKWAENLLNKSKFSEDDIIVGIQVAASSPIRSYPIDRLAETARELVARGCKIILFGHPTKHQMICRNIRTNVEDSTGKTDCVISGPETNMELRNSISLVNHLSLIIAPDSAFIHIAAAMHVPIIGLYGPFAATLRMKYYYNAIGLNADAACSPCFTHGHHPCVKGIPSPCFGALTPDIILLSAEMVLKNFVGKQLDDMDKFKHSEFEKVMPLCEEFMIGEGVDLGCGFSKHDGKDVTRVDTNPLCEPSLVGNYFDMKPDKKADYMISSFVVNDMDQLSGIVKVAKETIMLGGYLILYVGDYNIVSRIDTDFGKLRNLKEFFKSQLDPDKIIKYIGGEGLNLVVNHSEKQKWEENSQFFHPEIEKLNYGFLSIWQIKDPEPSKSLED